MATAQQVEQDIALYPSTITPPARPLPAYKFFWKFLRNPLSVLPQQVYEEPIVLYRSPAGMTVVWVTDPELTEQVLQNKEDVFVKTPLEKRVFSRSLREGVLTADGPQWRWQRRVISPVFRHAELLGYVPTISQSGNELVERWRRGGRAVRRIDRDMTDVTFTVVARTLLAGGEPAESDAIKRAGTTYLSHIPWEMVWELLHLPDWLPHPAVWQLNRSARTMRRSAGNIIERRRATAETDNDLLGRLLAARDPDTGAPMDDEMLIDNLLTLLVAGHETTAKALTWALYLLARAPQWQARLREEVRQVAGDAPIDAVHLEQLVAVDRVLKETMRLYPPAPVIARRPVRDTELAGLPIPADSQVVIPMYCVHRHRALWDDPDRFEPDRFSTNRAAGMPRTQYMPFGAGARTCIGMSFAMIEAKALLATFVRSARFEWDGRHMPQPVSRITLRPQGGMPLFVSCDDS
ncbi:MAG: cytochrome P450 [Hyphomicrobiaceae bacterium]